MNSRRPIIGITPSPSSDRMPHGKFRRYAMSSNYTEAVEEAGGVPVVLPPQDDNIEELLSITDGLLFSGGGDVDPARYGDADLHTNTYGIDELRDEFEFALLRQALERGVPVLCICRGIQVANVVLGGTLIQDIADQFSAEVEHRQNVAGFRPADHSHNVAVVPGSLLEAVYDSSVIRVNSYHHQGIRELSPELRIAGRAPDGVIEAVDRPGSAGWFLGVQWHPEMMFREHLEQRKPFEALVSEAARARDLAGDRLAAVEQEPILLERPG